MWFFSKKTKEYSSHKGAVRFLRKGLPEHRERRELKQEKQPGKGGVIFLWTIVLGTFIYIFLFSPFVLIEEIQVSGNSIVSGEALQGFVDDQLRGTYLNIFPKRSFLLVQPETLRKAILSEYPLLATVSVKRVFPNRIFIQVTEKKKILLWYSGENSFLVDENGATHDSTRALSPENNAFMIAIVDTSAQRVTLGDKVFDPKYGTFIIEAYREFSEQLGLSLEPRFTIGSRFAEEVRAKTDEGWEVYFSTEIPLETSLNTLKLLFEKELPKEKRMNLAYIDLRAENRAYYTFRNGTNSDTPAPVVSTDTKNQVKSGDTTVKKKK